MGSRDCPSSSKQINLPGSSIFYKGKYSKKGDSCLWVRNLNGSIIFIVFTGEELSHDEKCI
jgi:hypothetical protein